MKTTRRMLAATTTASAAEGTACPAAEDFSLTAPSHTEVGGNLLDKQITFGSYWTGGNLPGGTSATLTAGAAEVTLLNGETYTAPVVAGGTNSGLFPAVEPPWPRASAWTTPRGTLRTVPPTISTSPPSPTR